MNKTRIKETFSFAMLIFSGYILAALLTFFISIILFICGIEFGRLSPLLLIFIILLSCFILSLIFTSLRTKNHRKIIQELEQTLRNLKDGKYESAIKTRPKSPELVEIASNINIIIKEMNSNVILKKDFVRNFSHEFKTPITSIHGFSEILCTKDNISEEERMNYYLIIKEESKRLANLANNTLLLSKLDSESIVINKENFYIDEQFEECLLLFYEEANKKNIDVDVNLNHFEFYGSKELIKELIINLISNCIKYSNQDGSLSINSFESSNKHCISIKDNGIGMSDEVKAHIFDEYYQGDTTRKNNGIGLGMSIVKKICILHNIEIEIISKENEGSVFTLYFPIEK